MPKIKVIIIDDHIIVRKGLKQLLEADETIEVIAEADNGEDCLKLLENHSPDIIFMDIRMPGINGVETTRLICQKYPHLKVIILTIYEDDQLVTDAIQAGAKAYVLKDVKRNELIKVVHNVLKGKAYLDPNVAVNLFDKIKQQNVHLKGEKNPRLTPRELEILKYMVDGYTDRNIAKFLYISEYTVRSHIKNIFRKLGVSSKAGAVAKALQEKIINRDPQNHLS
jgi:DNA-binding NarL/FixJ family response regulator